jgi:hypothetical protein
VLYFVFEIVGRRFGGLIEARPVNVKQPTVIEAAEAAIFDASHAEISASVRTMKAENSRTAGVVAKQHQILAQ